LLANFLSHVLVLGIAFAQPTFKSINIIDPKFVGTNFLNTLHYFKKPPSLVQTGISKEQSFFPLSENLFSRSDRTILNDGDASRRGNSIKQNV